MLFREFNIIAAAAYAAEKAGGADGLYPVWRADGLYPVWDELSETEQMQHTERVMAVARGEGDGNNIFLETAKAILDYNNGQGGLALEKIASIGSDHFNLGLVTQAEVAGRDIAEVNQQLLHELAGLRQLLGAFGQAALHYAPVPTPAEEDPGPIETDEIPAEVEPGVVTVQ